MWRLDSHWGASCYKCLCCQTFWVNASSKQLKPAAAVDLQQTRMQPQFKDPDSAHARDNLGTYSTAHLQLWQRLCGPEVTRQGRQRLQHVAHLTAGPVAELQLPHSA